MRLSNYCSFCVATNRMKVIPRPAISRGRLHRACNISRYRLFAVCSVHKASVSRQVVGVVKKKALKNGGLSDRGREATLSSRVLNLLGLKNSKCRVVWAGCADPTIFRYPHSLIFCPTRPQESFSPNLDLSQCNVNLFLPQRQPLGLPPIQWRRSCGVLKAKLKNKIIFLFSLDVFIFTHQ